MTLPQRRGAHRGTILDAAVSETSTRKPQFVVKVALGEWYSTDDSMWYDVSAEMAEITGYFVLEKNNDELNEINVRQIMEALGWDGRSLASLGETDWAGRNVQVVIQDETFNNRTGPRVKALRAYDAPPVMEMRRLDSAGIKSHASRLDMKLRAMSPPKKPAATPPPAAKAPADEAVSQAVDDLKV